MTEAEALKIFKDGLLIENKIPLLAPAYEVAINALEKQIAKKVKLYIGEVPSCPVCNKRLRGYEGFKIAYCKSCGQLLKGEGVVDDCH